MRLKVIALNIALWLAAILHVGGVNPQWIFTTLEAMVLTSLVAFRAGGTSDGRAQGASSLADWLMGLQLCWLLGALPLGLLPGIGLNISLAVGALPLMYFLTRLLLSSGLSESTLQQPLWLVGVILLCIALPEFLASGERPYATFEDSNALAAFWNALFFPAYLALLSDWQTGTPLHRQRGRLTLLAAVLVALAFSTSLGAQLCWLAGLALSTLIAGPRRPKVWASVALALLVFLPSYQFANQYTGGARDPLVRFSAADSSPFTERLAMSHSALQAYADQPWYGSGLGTYKTVYPRYRSVEDHSTTGDLAHNDYVQFLLEGGPILLGTLLAMAALVAWRLWQLLPGVGREDLVASERLRIAGPVVALCCLLAHAAMNFIFYVLPLALIAGFYLARVEHAVPLRGSSWAPPLRQTALPALVVGAFGLFVAMTLGLQSLFVKLSTADCQIRACRTVRAAEKPVLELANLLAATQPTWLPARDYLVARLRDEALKFSDPAEQEKRRTAAALEVIQIIRDAPTVHYPYATLADLIVETPSISALVKPPLPSTAAGLYKMALERRPQDQGVRLQLARQLEASGEKRRAFDLVNDEGMTWWTNSTVSDSDRIATLRYMIPRAVSFGLCSDAHGMAASLRIFVPESALAKAALSISAPPESPGCGLVAGLPAE